MARLQQFAQRWLPDAWFEALRRSSLEWFIQCTVCGNEKSVWATGGVRWGAWTTGKRIAARCSHCDRVVAARVYRKPELGEGSAA
ncbi:MAG: hypothetical protein AAGD07_05225 [Planctomycetota bacterium]